MLNASMGRTQGRLLPIHNQSTEKKANPMIMYICSSEFISFEHFFMWDKQILRTISLYFKADLCWIMQMFGICGLQPTQVHEKEERIKANWCGSLSCVPRRAKIKLFNYCQVCLIRKQADDLARFNNCDLMVVLNKCVFSTVPF